ncbi:gp436 family protein [Paracoccus jiaweipingae]|uniref:gp436 family protein n=1 Tax=Paracoccus sp. p2-l61 TaxID=3366950 RepID=UPI00379326A3
MGYASVTDLKAVIPARDLALLTDFEGGADAAVDARLEQALTDASAEIDGYIAKQLPLPLADPPHVLSVICRDLAMHRLYRNLGHDAERLKALRGDAIGWLRDVASGKVALGDDDNPPPPSSGGVAMTDGPDRQLTRASLRGY